MREQEPYRQEAAAGPEQDPAGKVNLCFDCARACGGCPWSEYDPEAERVRFQTIPGWTAEKVTLQPVGQQGFVETYHITDCPLFRPDPPGRTERKERVEE